MIKRVARDEAELFPLPGRNWYTYVGPQNDADGAGLDGRLDLPARLEAGRPRPRHPGGDDLLRGRARPDRDARGDRRDRGGRDRLGPGRHLPRHRVRRARAARARLLLLPARRARARTRRRPGHERARSAHSGADAGEIARLDRGRPADPGRGHQGRQPRPGRPPRRPPVGGGHAGGALLPRPAHPPRRARLARPRPLRPVEGPLVDRPVRRDGPPRLLPGRRAGDLRRGPLAPPGPPRHDPPAGPRHVDRLARHGHLRRRWGWRWAPASPGATSAPT